MVDGSVVQSAYEEQYTTSSLSPGEHTVSCTTTSGSSSVTGRAVVRVNPVPAHVRIIAIPGRGLNTATTLTASTSDPAEVSYEWSPYTGLDVAYGAGPYPL